MLRYTFGLKKTLPAILAAMFIIFTPLFQLLHLSHCSCGLSHTKNVHNFRLKLINIDRSRLCHKADPSSKPKNHRHNHHHDSRQCPLCQIYSAINTGFNVPVNSFIQFLNTVCAERLIELDSLVLSVKVHFDFSPRAPPYIYR